MVMKPAIIEIHVSQQTQSQITCFLKSCYFMIDAMAKNDYLNCTFGDYMHVIKNH